MKDNNKNNNNSEGVPEEKLIKRLDREIDNSGDKDRIRERDDIRNEGISLLIRSQGILAMAVVLFEEATRLIGKKDSNQMEYDELERWYKDMENVNNKLESVNKMGKEIEKKCKELRIRVNKFYGVEVMKETDYSDYSNSIDNIWKHFSNTDINNISDGLPEGNEENDDNKWGGGFKEGDADWWKN